MERRSFIRTSGALAAASALSTLSACARQHSTVASGREVYEWRIYTLTGNGSELDKFYRDILIPAYNRKGVTVGAFKPLVSEEKEMRHVAFVYPDMDTFFKFKEGIWEDAVFTIAAKAFFEATAPKDANEYSNYETYLSQAFIKIPKHRKPDSSRGLLEIRIYWSPNEEANKRKVRMFNVDEIDIFDKVGVNSVFYGDIIAGPKMPALMYLTWYRDKDTRTEAWDKFGKHPDWQRIRSLPEYANTATNNQSVLLTPLPYSQL